MTDNLFILNSWVSTATLIFELIVLIHLFFYLAFIFGSSSTKNKITKFFHNNINQKLKLTGIPTTEKYFIIVFFLFSLGASVMTLVYSEYFGVIPCALCWFERIFMYGITVITATALFTNNKLEHKGILKYILNFSILGAVISLYHHVLQMTASVSAHLPCPASGGDCAKRIIFEYGHITFPWMAFVMFSFFIVIILFVRKLDW